MFDKDKAMRDFEKDFEHYKKTKKNLYGLINEVDEFRVTLHLFREKIHHYIIWGTNEY